MQQCKVIQSSAFKKLQYIWKPCNDRTHSVAYDIL